MGVQLLSPNGVIRQFHRKNFAAISPGTGLLPLYRHILLLALFKLQSRQPAAGVLGLGLGGRRQNRHAANRFDVVHEQSPLQLEFAPVPPANRAGFLHS
jgi:hypothetical protein